MLKSHIILEIYFAVIAKSKVLLNLDELIKFLKSWHGVAKYINNMLVYLQKNCKRVTSR